MKQPPHFFKLVWCQPGRHFGVKFAILVFSIALVAMMWTVVIAQAQFEQHEAIAGAIKQNETLAVALDEYAANSLDNVDVATRYAKREYLRLGPKINLARLMADLGIDAHAIAIVDEHGDVVVMTLTPKPFTFNAADREHFKIHMRQDNGEIFVGKPVLSRIFHKILIPVTRRINKPDGSFGGVVVVLIEPASLTSVYHSASIREHDVIALVGLDGVVRAERIGDTERTAEHFSETSIFSEQSVHASSSYFAQDKADGIRRLFSYRTLQKYPLMAVIATSEDDILAASRLRKNRYYLSAAAITTFIAFFAFHLIFVLARRKKMVSMLVDREARLAVTFNQANTGIAYAGLDGRFLMLNEKLCEMLGYTREELLQRTFSELTHPDDSAKNVSGREISGDRHSVTHNELEKRYLRKDGSVVWTTTALSVVHDSASNAQSFIAMVHDITARKLSEERLGKIARARHTKAECSRLLIHATNETGFLQDICSALVGPNGYQMAWAGFARGERTYPVAQARQDVTAHEWAPISWEDTGFAGNLSGREARADRARVSGNILADPDMTDWHKTARENGFNSVASLLLSNSSFKIGVLNIYASEIDAFDNEEVSLLVELATDAGHGITTLRTRAKLFYLTQELRESERRFRDMLGNLELISLMLDREGSIAYCNNFLLSLTGWQREEIIGRNWHDLFLPSGMEHAREAFLAPLDNMPQAWHMENAILARSGARLHIRWNNTVLRSREGEVIGVASIGEDITERKRMDAELREEEARFKSISSNIPGMVFQLRKIDDAEGIAFTFVSEGSVEVCGVGPEKICADPAVFTELLPPADRTSFYVSMRRSKKSLSIWNWEGQLEAQDKSMKWVNLRATPRRGLATDIIWDGVIFNITQTKQHEVELDQSRGMLRALSAHQVVVKEEERRRIAREIHDELGQRLTVLRMDMLMLPKMFEEQHEPLSEAIDPMRDAIDDILRIVRNIASELRPAALDIGIIFGIEWLVDEFQASLKMPCEFINRIGEKIVLDDERSTGIFRILQESMTNVARHAHATRVEVTVEIVDNHFCLEVRDNGAGFDETNESGKKSYGLVGMRERASMLGGEIKIVSETGKGTFIHACIPLQIDGGTT